MEPGTEAEAEALLSEWKCPSTALVDLGDAPSLSAEIVVRHAQGYYVLKVEGLEAGNGTTGFLAAHLHAHEGGRRWEANYISCNDPRKRLPNYFEKHPLMVGARSRAGHGSDEGRGTCVGYTASTRSRT